MRKFAKYLGGMTRALTHVGSKTVQIGLGSIVLGCARIHAGDPGGIELVLFGLTGCFLKDATRPTEEKE